MAHKKIKKNKKIGNRLSHLLLSHQFCFHKTKMVVLQFNSLGLVLPQTTKSCKATYLKCHIRLSQNWKFRQVRKLYAVEVDSQTTSTGESTTVDTAPSDSDEGPPVVDFAFINVSYSI
jgi:hypothetical protein